MRLLREVGNGELLVTLQGTGKSKNCYQRHIKQNSNARQTAARGEDIMVKCSPEGLHDSSMRLQHLPPGVVSPPQILEVVSGATPPFATTVSAALMSLMLSEWLTCLPSSSKTLDPTYQRRRRNEHAKNCPLGISTPVRSQDYSRQISSSVGRIKQEWALSEPVILLDKT